MDWFIEGKIFSPSLSLWYQSQRNYGSKQSIDCELRVNQYCVKKTRKKKKKGIICLLWCEGLRVAVWIQGNGLIIPFELIAKTGNFFFNVDYVFLFLFFNHVFSVSEKVFFSYLLPCYYFFSSVSENISSWIMKTSLRRKCIIICCYIIDISCTRSNCPLFWY